MCIGAVAQRESMVMLNWAYFPRSAKPTELALGVVQAFNAVDAVISSENNTLESNGALEKVRPHLVDLGFKVESGKKKIAENFCSCSLWKQWPSSQIF